MPQSSSVIIYWDAHSIFSLIMHHCNDFLHKKLCRWALILQEFDFKISYRSGSLNKHADALSRLPDQCATTILTPIEYLQELKQTQQSDPVISTLIKDICSKNHPHYSDPLLHCYSQLWSQLLITI